MLSLLTGAPGATYTVTLRIPIPKYQRRVPLMPELFFFFFPLWGGREPIGSSVLTYIIYVKGSARENLLVRLGPGLITLSARVTPSALKVGASAELMLPLDVGLQVPIIAALVGELTIQDPGPPPRQFNCTIQGGLQGTGLGSLLAAYIGSVDVEFDVLSLSLTGFSKHEKLLAGILLEFVVSSFYSYDCFGKKFCKFVKTAGPWQWGKGLLFTNDIDLAYLPGLGATVGTVDATVEPVPIGDVIKIVGHKMAPPPCPEAKQFILPLLLKMPGMAPSRPFPGPIPPIPPGPLGPPSVGPSRKQLALAICKCVGDAECGGGQIHKKCFDVDDRVCSNRGELQKAADKLCNHDPEMVDLCTRDGCRYRHTDAKCPVKEEECPAGGMAPGPARTCEAHDNLDEIADSFISRCCKASIRREFPGELLNETLGNIKAGKTAAHKKAWKLLNDNRFKK
jgi:hypothetical protein